MPQITFEYQGTACAAEMRKVDREALYGRVDTLVLDEAGQPCRAATLADDGQTLIPAGGIAQVWLNQDGEWLEKSALKPVDPEGTELRPAGSTLKETVALTDEATAEEYLDCAIRSLYALDAAAFPPALLEALDAGKIFRFPFSYRGGLDPDAGFLLKGQDGSCWLAAGKRHRIELVTLAQTAAPAENEAEEEEDPLMDFSAM